jgi:hypothetical protein
MSTLVEDLRLQHRALRTKMSALDDALAAADAVRTRAAVAELRHALLAHLAIEDRELYPALCALGAEDPDRRRQQVAQAFAASMRRISESLLAFLERPDDTEPAALADAWAGIRSILQTRIDAEEKTLYPLYQRAVLLSRSSPRP